jgi:hypothetical protein
VGAEKRVARVLNWLALLARSEAAKSLPRPSGILKEAGLDAAPRRPELIDLADRADRLRLRSADAGSGCCGRP